MPVFFQKGSGSPLSLSLVIPGQLDAEEIFDSVDWASALIVASEIKR
jgi:hypothetical protein